MGQIFVNDFDFICFIPMPTKSEAGDALTELIQDIGIPSAVHTDEAKTLTSGCWKQARLDHVIKQTQTEPYSPWQNHIEHGIQELKKYVRRLMTHSRASKRIWVFLCCICYRIENTNSSLFIFFAWQNIT